MEKDTVEAYAEKTKKDRAAEIANEAKEKADKEADEAMNLWKKHIDKKAEIDGEWDQKGTLWA